MRKDLLQFARLNFRVLLLERAALSGVVLALTRTGATLEQSKQVLTECLDRDKSGLQAGLSSFVSDPAKFGLLHDEFEEIVDEMKSYIASLRQE